MKITRSRKFQQDWCSESVAYRIIRFRTMWFFFIVFRCFFYKYVFFFFSFVNVFRATKIAVLDDHSLNWWCAVAWICCCFVVVVVFNVRPVYNGDEMLNVSTAMIAEANGNEDAFVFFYCCCCYSKLHINQGMPRTILCFSVRLLFGCAFFLCGNVLKYLLIVGRLSYAQDVSIANWYGFKVKKHQNDIK